MKSHRLSDGKKCLFSVILLVGLGFSTGCQTPSRTRVLEENSPVKLAEELNDEVSLKSDREQLKEMRQDVPEDKAVSNDELAMDLELMGKADKPPHEIRSRFQQKVRKLRQRFRDKSSSVRKKFRDEQKKQRDDFLNELKSEREDFRAEKPDREKTREFYARQDLERKDFFALQKEQRREFESEMQQKSKDFHANMSERVKQFDEQLRLYTKRRTEKLNEEKQAKEKQKNPKKPEGMFRTDPGLDKETEKILNEFDEMKSKPSEKLGN